MENLFGYFTPGYIKWRKGRINKWIIFKVIFPSVYKKAMKQPVDEKKVVFVEVRSLEITNSFKVIYDKLDNEYDFDIHTHFLGETKVKKSQYLKNCINMLKDIATAKYVFLNDASNCIGSIKKLRPETQIIQLWHGCGAFKKFGLSTADLIFGEDRKEKKKYPFYKNNTTVTVSSPEVVWAYEEAMDFEDDHSVVQPLGISRTDVFFDKDYIKSAYDKLYEAVPLAKGKKVILYAPTFRGRVVSARTPNQLNLGMFEDHFANDYVLLIKHHPFVKRPPAIAEEFSEFAFDVTQTLGIEDLLCVSDICITDYSSLVFEYSLFEKPIIFYAYDLDNYCDWRGFYYDYYEISPGPVCKTNKEMIHYIENLDTQFDKEKIKDFRYKFMRSCDGKSTDRILKYIFDKDKKEQ